LFTSDSSQIGMSSSVSADFDPRFGK
jgi:hypothetical protein